MRTKFDSEPFCQLHGTEHRPWVRSVISASDVNRLYVLDKGFVVTENVTAIRLAHVGIQIDKLLSEHGSLARWSFYKQNDPEATACQTLFLNNFIAAHQKFSCRLTLTDATRTIFRMKTSKNRAADQLKASPGKLYEHVATLIQKRIQSGELVKGERLPSIDALAGSFDVAVITVRRALRVLEEKGLINRYQGRGTFVAADAKEKRWLTLESNWDALIQMWGRSRPRSLKVADVSSSPSLNADDGVPAPGYRHMRRVHSSIGTPYAVSDLYVDRRLYALCPTRFDSEMVIVVLDSLADVSIKCMRQCLTIETAGIEEASLLQIPVGAPIGIVRRVIRDKADTVIYVGEATYRGDLVKLERELVKPDLSDAGVPSCLAAAST